MQLDLKKEGVALGDMCTEKFVNELVGRWLSLAVLIAFTEMSGKSVHTQTHLNEVSEVRKKHFVVWFSL